MVAKSLWKSEYDSALKKMNSTTTLSMAQMTEALNREFKTTFTRNAVIGRMTRLKIKDERPHPNQEGNGSKRVRKKKPGVRVTLMQQRLANAQEALPPVSEPQYDAGLPSEYSVLLEGLTSETCRWPLGEMKAHPPFVFCGRKPFAGAPYCPQHYITSRKGSDNDGLERSGPDFEHGDGVVSSPGEVKRGRRDDRPAEEPGGATQRRRRPRTQAVRQRPAQAASGEG